MRRFYSELAYFFGLAALALGTAFMEAANFGMSMVVAPAYLLHLKISAILPWFTFGIAEYLTQALVLLLLVVVMRKFRLRYLFAFVTTLLYGVLLDGCIWLVGFIPAAGIVVRIVFYILGLLIGSLGVSLLFHTYIAPEVYELFVKELSDKYGIATHRCKLWYDCASCAIAVILSFVFFGFGHFEGIKWGTILCALVNGPVIGWFSRFFEKHFVFTALLPKKEKAS